MEWLDAVRVHHHRLGDAAQTLEQKERAKLPMLSEWISLIPPDTLRENNHSPLPLSLCRVIPKNIKYNPAHTSKLRRDNLSSSVPDAGLTLIS
jgi:hypothetical protein